VPIFLYTGYGDKRTIARRIAKMEAWLRDPQLLEGSHNHIMIITTVTIMIVTITIILIFSIADAGAKYAAEIHINLEDIKVRKKINQLSSERPITPLTTTLSHV
jgi:aconitase B